MIKKIFFDLYSYIWHGIISKIPSHTLRYYYIKLINPSIQKSSTILMNVRIKGFKKITFSHNQVINQFVTLDGRGGLFIGSNVDIAERAVIWSMSHDPHNKHHSTVKKHTSIGDYAWVGSDSIILAGVTIGKGAVVGAGSVVTKDVAELDVVAGNPARVIGKRKAFPEYELQHKPLFS